MRYRQFFPKLVIAIVVLWLTPLAAWSEQQVRIGVLAKRGIDQTLTQWTATADYLSEKIPGHRFRVVPLGFLQLPNVVKNGGVDFVLANPFLYVDLERRLGINRILTLYNRVGSQTGLSQFGAVIISRKDNPEIKALQDLKGERFAAVHGRSLGGWLMAWRELRQHRLDPHKDFANIEFCGTHDEVVYAVRDGRAGAGTVRTDTLERMAQEGLINLTEFHLLNPQQSDFPLGLSTSLYPEWPLAKVSHTSQTLADQVAVALLQIPDHHPAAIAGLYSGWTLPLNYQPVHQLLRELKVSPYGPPAGVAAKVMLEEYGYWLFVGLIAILAALLAATYLNRLNQQLRMQHLAVERLNQDLERRVEERTAKITHLLDHVQDLLNSTAEAIFGLDLKGKCTFANPACLRMLGYSDPAELIGRDMHEITHHSRDDGSPYPQQECPILRAIAAGESTHYDNEVFWRADGSSFPVEYWSHPIRREGQVTGAVVAFLDITRRKKTAENLRRAQKMEAIGQLTGGIAHDFNNMLGIILGHLTLLRPQLSGKSLGQLESMEKSAQRAADLTRQLLGFSRTTEAEVAITDINQVIEEMGLLLDHTLGTGVEVERRLAADLWLTEVNPGDFQDCLLNLIINARDAMPEGGRLLLQTENITLDTAECTQNPKASPGDYLQLSITDFGVGMSQQQMEHIFEPFFTTKPKGKGTGLGLAMVYGFMQRSNGVIRVTSEQDKGASFYLYLPRTLNSPEPAVAFPEVDAEKPLRGTETILVVDDETGLLELAQLSLGALGYRVLTAADGRQAMQLVEQEPGIDLLFSDVVMPGDINGYRLADWAVAKRPQLKVLLTSGYSAGISPVSGGERFADSLLAKPYSQKELAKRIKALLATNDQPG